MSSFQLTTPQIQGIYKRYKIEKRKKVDQGQVNSQDSGLSLVEVNEPMDDIMPPSDQEEEEDDDESQRDR